MGTWKRVLLSPNYTEERTSWSISEINQRERTLRAELADNRDSCSERLCEGIGQTLRKDDSCDSTLAIVMNYLCMQ